ncbi:MAG: acyltransferase [Lentisphaeria bacterium]|nr:acyltransferase [Lentisphaeria bacterium]
MKSFLNKFQRQSSSGRFIPEIDSLRFIAIMAVMLYHLNDFLRIKTMRNISNDYLGSILKQGSFGVPLFFVISGFVIALPFIKAYKKNIPTPSYKQFFKRRLTRLEPPFLICMIASYGFLVLIKNNDFENLLPHFLATITYVHNYIYQKPSLINVVSWSLEVEFIFYAIAPFMLFIIFKLRNLILRQITVIISIVLISLLKLESNFYLFILGHIQYFLCGFLLCDVYVNQWKESPKKNFYWDIVGATAWLLIPLFLMYGYRAFLPAIVLLAYSSAFKGKLISKFFRYAPIYIIGGMCYSIYLWHFYFMAIAGNIMLKIFDFGHILYWVEVLFLSAVCIPFMILCSAIMFIYTEKPFMNPLWINILKVKLIK